MRCKVAPTNIKTFDSSSYLAIPTPLIELLQYQEWTLGKSDVSKNLGSANKLVRLFPTMSTFVFILGVNSSVCWEPMIQHFKNA